MSNELKKNSSEIKKINASINKPKIGQGMMAGLSASLSAIELPRMFNQLVIFLLDGSGSMTMPGTSGKSKGYEVHQAIIKILERLKDSKNKSSFDFAFWAFANESVKMFPVKSIKEFNLVTDCFNPCEFINDDRNTLLFDVFEFAKEQALIYLEKNKEQNTKVLIITLGDGAIQDYIKCFEIKEEIVKNPLISFCSILFESPEWYENYDAEFLEELKNNFSKLASNNADYMSTVDIDKIRTHMIQSITKISNI